MIGKTRPTRITKYGVSGGIGLSTFTSGKHATRRRQCRVQMHDRPGVRSRYVECAVHEDFFGRFVSRNVMKSVVKLRDPSRIQPAQTGIGRRDQIPVIDPHADIAGATD